PEVVLRTLVIHAAHPIAQATRRPATPEETQQLYLYFSDPKFRTWSISPSSIVDGTSNTVFFSERHVNINGVMAFSPDGRWITASGGYDNGVRLWDAATGGRVSTNFF